MAKAEAKANKKKTAGKKAKAKASGKTQVKAPVRVASRTARKPESVAAPVRWWRTSVQFLREVKVELKKTTWPSYKDTKASTLVVLVVVLICAVFLGFVDLGLSWIMRLFIW